ncbi:MAG: diaminopimelate epimerase, partial [Gemmatimonadota bacterium]
MNDREPAVARLVQRLLLERSGDERLKMGCAMFDAARALVIASLSIESETSPAADLRRSLLLRTYGRDLPPDVLAGVVARLARDPAGEPTPAHPTAAAACGVPAGRRAVGLAAGVPPLASGALAGAPFTKMSGGGNDFVVFDNRDGWFPARRRDVVAALCARGTGVGADAVLLLESSGGAGADFRMVYYNADGGEAPMCGNGALCIARFARALGLGRDGGVVFETGAGRYRAEVSETEPARVRLAMRDPGRVDAELREIVARGYERAGFADTGTPHLVVLVDDVHAVDVAAEGAALRHHPLFQPHGLNVNFVQALGPSELALRTYERGVEAETLSCGTGSTAAAILTELWGLTRPPVVVHPPGGCALTIGFEPGTSGAARSVTLEGDARVVFEGRL